MNLGVKKDKQEKNGRYFSKTESICVEKWYETNKTNEKRAQKDIAMKQKKRRWEPQTRRKYGKGDKQWGGERPTGPRGRLGDLNITKGAHPRHVKEPWPTRNYEQPLTPGGKGLHEGSKGRSKKRKKEGPKHDSLMTNRKNPTNKAGGPSSRGNSFCRGAH